jgi:cytoskeletal protein CcmA (bactofilin family)
LSDRKQFSFPGRSSAAAKEPESLSDSVGPITNLTVIGRAMMIRGQITSKESLHVEGQVDGTLDMPDFRLTVGPHGRVGADTKAREIEVLGTVAGDLEASKKITIRKGGRLVGDLRTPGITIEEGAYFKGKIEIVDSEEPQAAGTPSEGKKATAGL